MYYCRHCDIYLPIPEWDGHTIACPYCGEAMWEEEEEEE